MPTILKTKNSVTTTVAPTTLQQGELAVNITDKKMWVGNAATTPVQILGAGTTGTAAGSNTQVQYNSSGTLAGDADFTFNGTTVTMANDASISGLTVGKGGGALTDNTTVGYLALNVNTTGAYNTAVGRQALTSNITGAENAAFGWSSLYSNTGSNNTALGATSLYANTSGGSNTAVGNQALRFNTTASNNTAVGYQAGYTGTTAADCTVLGYKANYSNQTGVRVVAIGSLTLQANTVGDNTAVGTNAMYANTTGAYNVAMGSPDAGGIPNMRFNTTGSYNVALGAGTLANNTTASNNTAVGYQAGYSNTTGGGLTFIGSGTGYANTTGTDNVAVGSGNTAGYAFTTNTTGSFNSVLGSAALKLNTTGSYNTAIGFAALLSNTTASNNTAVGYQAGYSNTVGSTNVFVGYRAGYAFLGTSGGNNTFVGQQAGVAVTTGYGNCFYGVGSGSSMTTGNANSILGGYSGNQGGLDIRTASNYIVLSDGDGNPRTYWDNNGSQYTANANNVNLAEFRNSNASNTSNGFVIGADRNTTNGSFNAIVYYNYGAGAFKFKVLDSGTVQNTTGTYTTISDAKLKENVVDATPQLNKLVNTRVVNYNLIGDDLKQIGWVAQELEQVYPNLVFETPDKDKDGTDLGTTTKGVKLTVMIPILVKALQELNAKVEAQALEIAQLKGN